MAETPRPDVHVHAATSTIILAPTLVLLLPLLLLVLSQHAGAPLSPTFSGISMPCTPTITSAKRDAYTYTPSFIPLPTKPWTLDLCRGSPRSLCGMACREHCGKPSGIDSCCNRHIGGRWKLAVLSQNYLRVSHQSEPFEFVRTQVGAKGFDFLSCV